MNEEQVADIWLTFKEYLDKKHIENAAERFIDLMADYGVTDEVFKDSFGHCTYLDSAIKYYLDLDEDYDDDWED